MLLVSNMLLQYPDAYRAAGALTGPRLPGHSMSCKRLCCVEQVLCGLTCLAYNSDQVGLIRAAFSASFKASCAR